MIYGKFAEQKSARKQLKELCTTADGSGICSETKSLDLVLQSVGRKLSEFVVKTTDAAVDFLKRNIIRVITDGAGECVSFNLKEYFKNVRFVHISRSSLKI
jgi:hypothetical protein